MSPKPLRDVKGKLHKEPTIQETNGSRTLVLIPIFETKDRGDCTLTLKSNEFETVLTVYVTIQYRPNRLFKLERSND